MSESSSTYRCPKCEGTIQITTNSSTCEHCGFDVIQLLERIEMRDGATAGMARAIKKEMKA